MKLPTISIITPVYNGLPYIKECIESVQAQDFQDWEMIISDNCSTDGTNEYIKTLSDSRIKIYYQEENLGIFGNLNFAFTKATAPISQILCADDYFNKKDSLTLIVEYWKKAEPEIGFCRFNIVDSFQIKVLPSVVKNGDSEILFFIFGNIPGNLSNISLRTHIVNHIGGFNPSLPYSGDFDFWVRAARVFDMGIEAKNITFVRRHPGVASNYLNKKGELISQIFLVVEEIYIQLLHKFPELKFSLRFHANLIYECQQRNSAIKIVLKGNSDYYKALTLETNKVSFLFSSPYRWLLFVLSCGGRFFRTTSAKKLLNKSKNLK